MSLRGFFLVLGVPTDLTDELLPVDAEARREARIQRLKAAFQRRYRALVHRRRVIECLRQKLFNRQGADRREHIRESIERHEAAYRRSLARTLQIQEKLRSLQAKQKRSQRALTKR